MSRTITGEAAHSRHGKAEPSQPHELPRALLLVADRASRARLAGAMRPLARVTAMGTLADFHAAVAAADPSLALVVVESRDSVGLPTAPTVGDLRATRPALCVIGYCEMRGDGGDDVVGLVRAGAHDVIFREFDDTGIALVDAVRRARRSTTAARVVAALQGEIAPEGLRLLEHGVLYGTTPLTVPAAARALGVNRRTLVDWCRRAELFPPQIVLSWARLFVVGALMEASSYSVDRIAIDLGYPSSPALHNAFRRHAGCRAQDVRRGGGLPFLLERFRRRRAEWRQEGTRADERASRRASTGG